MRDEACIANAVSACVTFELVGVETGEMMVSQSATPLKALQMVLKIAKVGEPFETVTSESFDIHVLLTEEPKDGFVAKILVDVGDKATVGDQLLTLAWRLQLPTNGTGIAIDLR